MQSLKCFLILFKYEIKSFLAYLREKSNRLAGFILGLVLVLLYLIGTLFILNFPYMQNFLISRKSEIISSISSGIFFLCIIAIANGFSIVTSVRRGQRRRIELLLQLPIKSKDVFRFFLIINSLVVVLIWILIAYIPLILLLNTIGITFVNLVIFSVAFLLYIMAFASIGCMLGVFYIKVPTRKRLLLSIVFAIVFAIVYAKFYLISYREAIAFLNILHELSKFIGSSLSPFGWLIATLNFSVTSWPSLIEVILSYIFSISLIEASTRLLTHKYLTGTIKAPSEVIRYRYEYKRGIIYQLFGSDLGGIFRKELKVFMRSPAMISGFIFTYVFLIIMLTVFPSRISDPEIARAIIPLFVVMFSIVFAIIPAISIIPTSLALERKNLALLLSSPVDPSKIIRGKALLSEILNAVIIITLIPIMFMYQLPPIEILITIALIIDIVLFIMGIISYIAVKYTDFKAENPRKALRTTGALIITGIIMVLYLIVPFALFMIIQSNLRLYVLLALVAIVPFFYKIRCMFLNLAGKYLSKLEATEYM